METAEPAVEGSCDPDASVHCRKPRVLYMSPQGRVFDQQFAEELAREKDLVMLCGHYEGVDERVLELMEAEEVSIGDYVLTGGELPALVMIDAIARKIPGVLKEGSGDVESFRGNLLEYPQYTRPEVWHDARVPEILISGDHKKVDRWRREESLRKTLKNRPDLLRTAYLSKEDKAFLKTLRESDGIGP
jgi:tRNA (guanine37-N1)-methyltransferase